MNNNKLEIIELIEQEQDKARLTILYKIKHDNWEACVYMGAPPDRYHPGARYKGDRYKGLQKTVIWKEGKEHYKQYRLLEVDMLTCDHCGRSLPKSFHLHHETYSETFTNYFTPLFLECLCARCHAKIHEVGKK